MLFIKSVFKKYLYIFEIVFILIWISNLARTDANFIIYVIVGFFSLFLRISPRYSVNISLPCSLPVALLSFLFSFICFLANYPLFTSIGDPAVIGYSTSVLVNLIDSTLSLIGGWFTAYPIFTFCFSYLPVQIRYIDKRETRHLFPWLIFISFLAVNFIHLFLVEYPGNVTEDPFTQISEMMSGVYSNFNTFWHTMLFQSVLSACYSLFSDINAAVACFCVFQTIILSFAFTYSLITIQRCGVPRWVLVSAYLIYAVVPYNIALSITIWKDVLFAAGCLMIVSSWLRIMNRVVRNSYLDYIVFILGSLLFIMSRTNGWLIYLVSCLLFVVFYRHERKLKAVMSILAVLGWFLLNPALSLMNIPGGDLAESLSVPIQQVSRVIAEGCDLSDDEEILLSKVVDLEEVPQLYTNWISDPMKIELRSKDYDYFKDHISDYAGLWLRLGMKYPWQYVKAWVDQTKGYWNAGYDYPLYSETIVDNPYGVEKTGGNNPIASLFRLYFGLSRHVIFFEPLHSIGMHVWIFLLCFIINLKNKREFWICSVPLVLLVVGLWLGTPVYCSFRYIYPLFVSFPLIVSTAVFIPKETL